MQALLALACVGLCAWAVRIWWVLRHAKATKPLGDAPISTMAVLGSGGHTAEMIGLLRTLDAGQFSPMMYVLANSDHTSAQRIQAFEINRANLGVNAQHNYLLLRVPRSREVGQSYLTSIASTLYAMLHSIWLVLRLRPSLVLCNGPGTCIPICAVAWTVRAYHP